MKRKNKNRWRIIFYGAYDEQDSMVTIDNCIRGYDTTTLRNFIEHTLGIKKKLVIYNMYLNSN